MGAFDNTMVAATFVGPDPDAVGEEENVSTVFRTTVLACGRRVAGR
jgi:hypothetical protein